VTRVLASDALCHPGPLRPGWVAIDQGQIIEVGTGAPPDGAEEVEGILAPGFVDLQVNGHGDVDFAAADVPALRRASDALAGTGTTSFCPTVVSRELATYDEVLSRLGEIGVGIHLEGPFLGGAVGAHDPRHVRPLDLQPLLALVERHPVAMVTLAPEADPGFRGVRALAERGVLVALGHSTATYDEVVAATDAGARVVTHLFNAMVGFHHREPGLVGAALDDRRLVPTLIADLVHVHPAALRVAIAATPRAVLVSDAVARGTGRRPDGTLAGSEITLADAVRNVASIGIPVERAVAMASTIPSDLLGLADRGRIEVGQRADLVVLDPRTLRVDRTVRAGREITSRL